ADRLLERLAGLEVAARKRPVAALRLAAPLPEEDMQSTVPHLDDDRERHVLGAWPRCCGRLARRFSPHSRKPSANAPTPAPAAPRRPACRRLWRLEELERDGHRDRRLR